MWLNRHEQAALTVLGVLALAGLGVLAWQQQRLPLMIEETPAQAVEWDRALQGARQVDVNTATVAELERLPQVGPTLAQRIVEYRTRHGRFRRPEELSRVSGIGPKTYQGLRDHITVDGGR